MTRHLTAAHPERNFVEIYFFLIPIALIFVAVALRFLFWAINSGQYDNLDTEAHRILFDEDENDIAPIAEAPAIDKPIPSAEVSPDSPPNPPPTLVSPAPGKPS